MPSKVDTEKLNILLKKVNHPGRYVGTEIGLTNKSFIDATVKAVLAFPDLYEVGISNFGLKIIYNMINSTQTFFADRVYAPDKDFRQLLIDNSIDLYGVETFIPVGKFDVVAFSLQYELNLTTMLGMLELGKIPLYSADRTDEDPLVIAGGPTCFNPEPMADFIDAMLIGDGEEVIIELLEKIEQLKKNNITSRALILKALSEIKGVYVPSLYKVDETNFLPTPINSDTPAIVTKRCSGLNTEYHPDMFPIPYIAAIHDRTVVEIRRGCARMCRFCQSGFVNLPVRERSPEDIKNLCRKSLELSGYEELSLLSLSANDYTNLDNLAVELNEEFASKKISFCLPSQRADNFNIELARQLQTVRKSTITFAPEAGSERLRKIINKNLTQDQIINAILSAYSSGWNKIKLYFILGLPTETYEDLDAIIDLIKLIKTSANKLRGSTGKIKKLLELTCTISILVPRPFTPFQWSGQLESDEIEKRKSYLINKIRPLKGVKLNFHDTFPSKLECLIARGNRSLSKLIYNAYKNGAYLDSWTDYFSKTTWLNSALESQVDIEKLTTTELDCNETLPWEIIDTGINKQWLLQERMCALEEKLSNPCEENCTNCGVCVNLNVSPNYQSREEIKKSYFQTQAVKNYNQKFKYRLKLTKQDNLRYISHLDWYRVIYRATRRANLPVVFTEGFNPSPRISIGLPLALFIESISEFMDIELSENLTEDYIKCTLNSVLPNACKVLDAKSIALKSDSIDKVACWVEYEALEEVKSDTAYDFNQLEEAINLLLSQDNIIIIKKTKSKTKELDIKPLIHSLKVSKNEPERIIFTLSITAEATVKPDELLNLFSDSQKWKITRRKIMDKEFKSL